jgi:glycosyltransferase involved in cell wall biosynthesis
MTDLQNSTDSIRVSIIVPVYNEIATLEEILTRVRAQHIEGIEFEIVVVDDGSTDGSREFLDTHPALYDQYLKNPKNLGKGGAVKCAMQAATGEYILFQDADLEYDPADYGIILEMVLRFDADIVIGSRFLSARWTRVFHFWNRIGNWVITNWFNLLFGTTWTDVYSCYLLFRKSLVPPEDLRTMRWEQQAEILAKASLKGQRFYDVGISYNGRTFEEGKKIRWYHTFVVLTTMLKVRLFG